MEHYCLHLYGGRARTMLLIGNKNKKGLIKNKKKPPLVDRMVLNGKSKLKFSNFTFIITSLCKR